MRLMLVPLPALPLLVKADLSESWYSRKRSSSELVSSGSDSLSSSYSPLGCSCKSANSFSEEREGGGFGAPLGNADLYARSLVSLRDRRKEV